VSVFSGRDHIFCATLRRPNDTSYYEDENRNPINFVLLKSANPSTEPVLIVFDHQHQEHVCDLKKIIDHFIEHHNWPNVLKEKLYADCLLDEPHTYSTEAEKSIVSEPSNHMPDFDKKPVDDMQDISMASPTPSTSMASSTTTPSSTVSPSISPSESESKELTKTKKSGHGFFSKNTKKLEKKVSTSQSAQDMMSISSQTPTPSASISNAESRKYTEEKKSGFFGGKRHGKKPAKEHKNKTESKKSII
jgi:hypothetical protein